MRWIEIEEAAYAAKAAKVAQRRLKARHKLNNARRKRSEAGRRYQDQLRKAGEAERDAQAKLREDDARE